MKLNHINLVVTNVERSVDLFVKHFGFTLSATKGNNVIAILNGADDFTLVLMVSKENFIYPPAFHIGFMQSSADIVSQIYNDLKADGFDVGKEPAKIRDSFGFYFTFDNIMIEVGHYL